jgi:SpoVK/Ycf46/Vps4 family AAA+-type ATPase
MAVDRFDSRQVPGAQSTATTPSGLAALAQQLRGQRFGRVIVLQGPPYQRAAVAQALARELGSHINLGPVVSKYIGETEKNLAQIFAAANHAGGILFFDEADSLFGKRTEVKDSHDRYANLQTFQGLLLLGVDRKENLPPDLVQRSRVISTQDYWPPR